MPVRSILISILILLIDFYIFQGVKLLFGDYSQVSKKIIYSVYWSITFYALFIIILNTVIDFHLWPKAFRVYSFAFIFITYISKLFVVVFLILDDLVRLIRWGISFFYQKETIGNSDLLPSATGISRLEFFTKAGIFLGAIPFFALIYGMVRGPYRFEVRKMKLHLPPLPPAFNGLKILQISDIHIGSFIGPKQIEKAIQLINKQQADIVFFTGDLVNDKAEETDEYLHLLKEIKAPMGIYSVLGNHDYGDYVQWPSKEAKAANLEKLKTIQKELGWRLLLNEHVILEKGNDKIGLIGIENWSNFGNFPKYGKMAEAVKGMPAVPVKILLSHDPSHWDGQVTKDYKDINLALAGHTHGMQFGVEIAGFKWSPIQYMYKQWAGLYQNGNQLLYVNRGLGFIGYPGRVGIMPEITVFELSNQKS